MCDPGRHPGRYSFLSAFVRLSQRLSYMHYVNKHTLAVRQTQTHTILCAYYVYGSFQLLGITHVKTTFSEGNYRVVSYSFQKKIFFSMLIPEGVENEFSRIYRKQVIPLILPYLEMNGRNTHFSCLHGLKFINSLHITILLCQTTC